MFKFHRFDVRRKVASLVFLKGVMSGPVDDPELLAGVLWHVPSKIAHLGIEPRSRQVRSFDRLITSIISVEVLKI
ncbi:hypothetical protein J6590_084193 [Homalodisca vitripennis]|nr:hypothetical protein J6590_084193 [Homalodisca vitripennis]